MLTTYRRVLALPGALVFSASGLVARLPISMMTLGIVLLVSALTKYPLGIAKVLPFTIHSAGDYLAAALLMVAGRSYFRSMR